MLVIPAILALEAAQPPHLEARRVAAPPAIDGRLDEPAWRDAPEADAFTQKRPVEGEPPVERTSVRVLYDSDAVYIGVACDQAKAPVVARLTRRDRQVEADSVTIALDTRGDGKSAFEFGVNAAGVLSDALRSNDTAVSSEWDEVWDARTAITDRGWSAEMRIPLHALRFTPRPIQSWGFQVRRYVSARQELDEWSFTPKEDAREVSRYGRLDGIAGLHAKDYLEVLPFVTARLRHRDVAPGAEGSGWEPAASAGLDLRWHVTPRLTLNATVNPDFGQVEADPAVLNLDTFEVFFPEKRPFFLEGADTFSTPLGLLYTRRIGRAPDEPELIEEDPYGEELTEDPEPATIYGAAKLVGDLGDRISIGQLVAVTGSQRVAARRADGSTALRLADPLTTFKVLRLRGDVGAGVELGVMATATNRLEPDGAYPSVPGGGGLRLRCPGGEEVRPGARCFHDAYVAGVDGRWRSPGGDYVAEAQVAGSLIQEGPPRTMPDGTVIASGDASPMGEGRVAKEGGSVVWEVEYEGTGRRADYNDLGFMRRQNQHHVFGGVWYRTLAPWWETLETKTGVAIFDGETLDLLNLERGGFLESSVTLKSFWELYAAVGYIAPRFDDREVGDGAALERADAVRAEAYIGTDKRAVVRGELYGFIGALEGHARVIGEAVLTLNVLPQLDLSLAPALQYVDGEPRYFATEGGYHLFGRQRAQSFALTLRSTYTFTPRLTLEAYAQAFVAAEGYSDYSAYPAPASGPPPRIRLRDLGPAPAVIEADPDVQSGSLHANLVLRWEYRVGSTIYLVYTHAQSDDETPTGSAALSFKLLRPRLASDALLLKASYWWG
jgi:hypothetical protein